MIPRKTRASKKSEDVAAGQQADGGQLKPTANGVILPKVANAPDKGKRKSTQKIKVDVNSLPHGLGVKAEVSDALATDTKANEAAAEPGPLQPVPSKVEAVTEGATEPESEVVVTSAGSIESAEPPVNSRRRNPQRKVRLQLDPSKVAIATGGAVAPESQAANSSADGIESIEPPVKPRRKNARQKVKLGVSPYPELERPSPEECYTMNRLLSETHGKVQAPADIPVPSRTVAGCGEVKFVLEALVRTHLSAHTSMSNANRAIQGLLKRYPTIKTGPCAGTTDWNNVRITDQQELEDAIKAGGMAPTKSKAIKKMLEMVYDENQVRRQGLREKASYAASVEEVKAEVVDTVEISEDPLSGDTKAAVMGRFANQVLLESDDILTLDYIHAMDPVEAFAKLTTYPGIGVKTAACVLLFCMQRPFFAVDTHVWRICKWLGWVPETADRNNTFWHCDVKVPDGLKYSLHQLMIAHGKSCGRCRANTSENSEAWAEGCPIEGLVKRTGVRKGGEEEAKPKRRKRKSEEKDQEEELGEDDEKEEAEEQPRKRARKTKGKAGAEEEPKKKARKTKGKADGEAHVKTTRASTRSNRRANSFEEAEDETERSATLAKTKKKPAASKKKVANTGKSQVGNSNEAVHNDTVQADGKARATRQKANASKEVSNGPAASKGRSPRTKKSATTEEEGANEEFGASR